MWPAGAYTRGQPLNPDHQDRSPGETGMAQVVIAVVVVTDLLAYLTFNLDRSATFSYSYWFGHALGIDDTVFAPFNALRPAVRQLPVA